MAKETTLDSIVKILVLIGGWNLGFMGFGLFTNSYNILNMIFGSIPALENLIYLSIGLSAVYMTYTAYLKK